MKNLINKIDRDILIRMLGVITVIVLLVKGVFMYVEKPYKDIIKNSNQQIFMLNEMEYKFNKKVEAEDRKSKEFLSTLYKEHLEIKEELDEIKEKKRLNLIKKGSIYHF